MNNSVPVNNNILSIIAAALVGQGESADLSALLNAAGSNLPAPQPCPAVKWNNTAKTGKGKFGYVRTDEGPMKTFYEWLTCNVKARFRHFSILKLVDRLQACPDYPRSCDLAVNCEKLAEIQLTAEELQGLIIVWQSYYTYTARWKSRHC